MVHQNHQQVKHAADHLMVPCACLYMLQTLCLLKDSRLSTSLTQPCNIAALSGLLYSSAVKPCCRVQAICLQGVYIVDELACINDASKLGTLVTSPALNIVTALRVYKVQCLSADSTSAVLRVEAKPHEMFCVQAMTCTTPKPDTLLLPQEGSLTHPQPLRLLPRQQRPKLLSKGPATPLSRGPAPPLSRGPATPLSRGPATPFSRGPTTPLSRGPATPLNRGPATALNPWKICRSTAQALTRILLLRPQR